MYQIAVQKKNFGESVQGKLIVVYNIYVCRFILVGLQGTFTWTGDCREENWDGF